MGLQRLAKSSKSAIRNAERDIMRSIKLQAPCVHGFDLMVGRQVPIRTCPVPMKTSIHDDTVVVRRGSNALYSSCMILDYFLYIVGRCL